MADHLPSYQNMFRCHVKRTDGVFTVHGSDADDFSPEMVLLQTKTLGIQDGKKYRVTFVEVPE